MPKSSPPDLSLVCPPALPLLALRVPSQPCGLSHSPHQPGPPIQTPGQLVLDFLWHQHWAGFPQAHMCSLGCDSACEGSEAWHAQDPCPESVAKPCVRRGSMLRALVQQPPACGKRSPTSPF